MFQNVLTSALSDGPGLAVTKRSADSGRGLASLKKRHQTVSADELRAHAVGTGVLDGCTGLVQLGVDSVDVSHSNRGRVGQRCEEHAFWNEKRAKTKKQRTFMSALQLLPEALHASFQ